MSIRYYDILADYGDGYIKVASHPVPQLASAIAQAEHRFINTTAHRVMVRRSDQRHLITKDSDGRELLWERKFG